MEEVGTSKAAKDVACLSMFCDGCLFFGGSDCGGFGLFMAFVLWTQEFSLPQRCRVLLIWRRLGTISQPSDARG